MQEPILGVRVEHDRRDIRRTAVADTVEAAFAFVLTAIETEGIDMPTITVEPVATWNGPAVDEGEAIPDFEENTVVRFEVSVAGPVPLDPDRTDK